MNNRATKSLPVWIWHPDREKRPSTVLAKSWVTARPLSGVTFSLAFTGGANLYLDGVLIESFAEHANHAAAFRKVDSFPRELGAGTHDIRLELTSTAFVPLHPVNYYLWDRTVGAIAFLQADDAWIVTDESWEADGAAAARIALYGEEPYGDLDQSPDWFARGGFDDIEAYPLAEVEVLEVRSAASANRNGEIALTGTTASPVRLNGYVQQSLPLFYHLRKQEQWAFMRAQQNELDLSGAPSAIIDIGKEYNCRFYADNQGDRPVTLLWNGAESLHELQHYKGCITETLEVAAGSSAFTLPQGFRYFRLFVLGAGNEPFALNLRFESVHVGLNRTGTLRTDKGLLDAVYEVSAHTSKICHQTGLWDGIKRDRLNWTFDFYLAAKSCYFLWDDYKVVKRAIAEIGIGTPYGYWMNGICEYTMWWVKTVCEYYAHTKDAAFVMEMKEPLQRHLSWIEANVDLEKGGIKLADGILIEWVPLTDEQRLLGLQAIYALMLKDLNELASRVPELGLSYDLPLRAIGEEAFTREPNALAIKALGIASGYVSEAGARAFLSTYRLADPFTPLSAYQLAECYSAYGMHEKAYETIEAVWGGMIANGATTFWEAFKLEYEGDFHDALTTYTAYDSYRMSLCHAWSSTPVKWISETLLGVKALEPGFESIRFDPIAVGGIRACEGTIQTPFGAIAVKWKLDDNNAMVADIAAPEGIRVIAE